MNDTLNMDKIGNFMDQLSKRKGFVLYTTLGIFTAYLLYVLFVGITADTKGDFKTKITPMPKTKIEKAIIVSNAFIDPLEKELNDGWLPNNIELTSLLDNKVNYQIYTVSAAVEMIKIFSTEIARTGQGDNEFEPLFEVYNRLWSFDPKSFWFTEKTYRKGISNIRLYQEEMKKGNKLIDYNLRTDDLYKVINASITLLEKPHSWLKQGISSGTADDKVYAAKAINAYLYSVIFTITEIHPDIVRRGGADNIYYALEKMREINEFEPLVVMPGGKDGDEMIPNHVSPLSEKLNELIDRLNETKSAMQF